MSNDSDDSFPPYPKKIREQRPITARSLTAMSISALMTFSGALVFGTWRIRDFLQAQTDAQNATTVELRAIRNELVSYSRDSWTLADMERWAGRFRWENRDKGIIVNEPREARQ